MSVLDGPGEGTWSVFAMKVVEERDELRHKLAGEAAHIKSLEDLLVDAVRERDEAYVEIQKLRAERRQLKHRVMECLKWVGVVPYPNTKGFSEMIAVRDLATDTLEEIKE